MRQPAEDPDLLPHSRPIRRKTGQESKRQLNSASLCFSLYKHTEAQKTVAQLREVVLKHDLTANEGASMDGKRRLREGERESGRVLITAMHLSERYLELKRTTCSQTSS